MINPSTHQNLVKVLFVALFIVIVVAIGLVMSTCVSRWDGLLTIAFLTFVQIINLGVAYEFTEWTLACIVKKQDLQKLLALKRHPPVAILYLTCNDFIPSLVSRLPNQTYPNFAIFILDDSTQIEYRSKVDNCGLPVVRRKTRLNFKAGNINHWFKHHGCYFDYLVVLDNDSLIPDNFVEEMVKYAEHKANLDVAIFQSSVEIWNQENQFARALDLIRSIRTFITERIDNPCESILPTTNFLVRTSVIRTIGGFATRSCTEDWETGLEVIAKGFRCQRVSVPSYVSMSTNPRLHTRRMTRWACGLLEIAKSGIKNVPLTTNLRLFMGIYFYMIWPIYIVELIFITIWGYRITWDDLRNLVNLSWPSYPFGKSLLLYLLILLFVHCVYFLILRPLLAYRMGIPLRAYISHVLVASAMSFYAFAPLFKAQMLVLFGKRMQWDGIQAEPLTGTFQSELREMGLLLFFPGIILVGLIQNPLVTLLNFFWLIPLFLSPFVLYFWQCPAVNHHPDQREAIHLSVNLEGETSN